MDCCRDKEDLKECSHDECGCQLKGHCDCQPKEIDLNELVGSVKQWVIDKGIAEKATLKSSYDKMQEELDEVFDSFANGDIENEQMELGDVIVTTISYAIVRGFNWQNCLNMAYNKIKDRKGQMINGQFVKE